MSLSHCRKCCKAFNCRSIRATNAAEAELERALREVAAAKQELAMAKADLNYWQAEIERAKTLYEQKSHLQG